MMVSLLPVAEQVQVAFCSSSAND
jgi:hypothetical protein